MGWIITRVGWNLIKGESLEHEESTSTLWKFIQSEEAAEDLLAIGLAQV